MNFKKYFLPQSTVERLLYVLLFIVIVASMLLAIFQINQNRQAKIALSHEVQISSQQKTELANQSAELAAIKALGLQQVSQFTNFQAQQACLFNLFVSYINNHTQITTADVANCQVIVSSLGGATGSTKSA